MKTTHAISDVKLGESEGRLRSILDSQSEMVCRFRFDGTILFANRSYAVSLGTTPSKLEGKSFWDFVSEADRPSVVALLAELTPDNPEVVSENRFETSAGTVWTRWVNRVVQFDGSGRWVEAQSTGIDITGRKLAEEKLAESERRYRDLAELVPAMLWVADANGVTTDHTRKWREYTGQTPEQALGDGWKNIVYPDDLQRVSEHWSECVRTGKDYAIEFRIRRASDETYRWHLVEAKLQRDEQGEPRAWFGACIDIENRKEAEAALRASEERLKRVLETDAVGVLFWDREGILTDANDIFLRMTGYTREDIESKRLHWRGLTAPEYVSASEAELEKLAVAGRVGPYEKEYFCKDGSRTWMLFAGRDLGDGSIVEFAIDITERKKTEMALHRSELCYRTLVEAASLVTWSCPSSGLHVVRQPAWMEFSGQTAKEMLGDGWTNALHPEDRASVAKRWTDAVSRGEPFVSEHRLRRHDGLWRWLSVHATPIRDDRGQIIEWFGMNLDITERKQQEERIKLLLREVNHRAKNLLSLVLVIARQTVAVSSGECLKRFSERIMALAASQDLLVRGEWQGVELKDLVSSQLAHLKDLIGTRIVLEGPSVIVQASKTEPLGMAIHELATNAGKYGALSASEGRVTITWGLEHANNGSGETFTLSWREQDGPPIAPPSRKGFGSTVIGFLIETSLQGKVDLEFAKTGLFWRVHCPASEVFEGSKTASNVQVAKLDCSANPGYRPKVLVVEDEGLVAMEIAQVLRAANFEVLGPVRSVAPALSLLDETGCDVAVLDINLGGETSEPIAWRLLANKTPFIALSGYSRSQHPPVFSSAPALTKPLVPDLLITEINRCLASPENRAGSVEEKQQPAV